ncbi:paired box protein Pax-3-B-like isoform X2 [Stylophora pistillata]|uniref:paired box protein Pax-3-B-like isoform X2 n=1 Tax=Stylophora pistillata TaxID=50429 RepID=UPI000C03E9A9|nr:paired box protein Pax-3-B-like isoform X2 [Stylophora pistillata]
MKTMDFCVSVPGTGRVNQLGGIYINGKPLPIEVREEIIELARRGVRPCDISRRLKITHGCISKLLSKYRKTGSINVGGANVGRPRVITLIMEQKIEQYRREQPGIFSWELRDRLLRENVCSRENLPSLSSISRLIKNKMMSLVSNKKLECSTNESDPPAVNTNTSYSNGFNQINVRRSTLDKDCLISGRHRRKRAKYTKKQLIKLELEFERNPYPNSWERESLAQQLGINETRIQVWFSNRRAKGRRERFGDEGTQRKAIPAQVCTCHTYCKPLRAPWMMETGFPTLFFPAAGYWT